MDRRSFLILAGSVVPASGCVAVGYRGRAGGEPDASAACTSTERMVVPLARQGFPATVCKEQPKLDLVTAIRAPAFASDWSGIEVPDRYRLPEGLEADSVVLGLTAGGRARAYPLAVLRRHEVVNDRFGRPVLVTFCPLCGSGMVARRVVAGEPTQFGVSGLLWKAPDAYAGASQQDGQVFGVGADGSRTDVRNTGNLVLYDAATGSYWSQILAQAICGPRRGAGLEILPSTVATWRRWRRNHPKTDVLLPPPHSEAENPPLPD